MADFEEKTTTETNGEATVTETKEVAPVVHICATPNCGKPASMACPTCLKLGIPPSRFCDQQCFKDNWEQHKALHSSIKKARAAKDPSTMPSEFKGTIFIHISC